MGRLRYLPPTVGTLGNRTRYEQNQQADERRGSSRSRGYTTAWDKASKRYREENPVCQYGLAAALGPKHLAPSTRVDHLYPQRTFEGVFWERQWWVASCDDCDALKQALEHQGRPALDALAQRMSRPTL